MSGKRSLSVVWFLTACLLVVGTYMEWREPTFAHFMIVAGSLTGLIYAINAALE